MVRSGTRQDHVRGEIIESLNERLLAIETERSEEGVMIEFNQVLSVCIAANLIEREQADRMVTLIEQKKLDPEIALRRVKDKAVAAGVIKLVDSKVEETVT